ncbi:hypothetical protein ACWDV7_38950 [Streptomyces sp. NPDC003362]
MPRIFSTQRLVMAAASTVLTAAGVLVPTSAFAAPASHTGTVAMTTAGHGDHKKYGNDKDKKYGKDSKHKKSRYGGNKNGPVTIIVIGNNNTVNGNGNGNGNGNSLT